MDPKVKRNEQFKDNNVADQDYLDILEKITVNKFFSNRQKEQNNQTMLSDSSNESNITQIL